MPKPKNLFLIFGILFIIAGFAISLIRLPKIQDFVIMICEKAKGQELNLSYTFQKLQSFIIMNTLILIFIGIGLLLARKINFYKFKTSNSAEFALFSRTTFGPKKTFAVILLFFVITVGLHVYWSTQKINYHQDECYGIGLANISEHNFWTGKKFPNYTPFTGEQIKTDVFFDNASLGDAAHDLAKLWFYNNDTAYTSLYLMLFRLSFLGVKTYNFSTIVFHSAVLNLICLCFAFYFLLRILSLLKINDRLKPFIILLAFITRAAVMNTIYIREYAFQQAILLMFTYLFIFYFNAVSEDKNIITKKNFIKTTLTLGIVLSTSYFTLFCITIFGLFLIGYSIYKKRFENCLFLISSVLISMLVAKILYLNWGSTLLTGRGAEALSGNGKYGFIENLHFFNEYIGYCFMNFPFMYILAICSALGTIYSIKTEKKEFIPFATALLATIWAFFVTYITPNKGPIYTSYILACFPIFPLFYIPILEAFEKNKIKKYINIALIIFSTIIFLLNIVPTNKNRQTLPHLADTPLDHSSPTFVSEPDIPVVIKDTSSYPEILPYLADKQTYWFAKSTDDAIANIPELTDVFFYVEFKYHEIPYSIKKIDKQTYKMEQE